MCSTRSRGLVLLILSGALAGCYDAHLRLEPISVTSDAGVAPDTMIASDASSVATNGCGLPTELLEVPAGRCVERVFTDTAGNLCDRGDESARMVVHVRRPPSGGEWYFLIRSRDRAAEQIALGRLDEDVCSCRAHASASGGDLTRSGIGGDLGTRDDELDLVLDGDERALWLRICDGPPR